MMLNIASEPMTTPMTKPRRAKKLRSRSGASARRSAVSSRKNCHDSEVPASSRASDDTKTRRNRKENPRSCRPDHVGQSIGPSVPRRGELIYQVRHNVFCTGIVDLTGSGCHMSAAAIRKTDRPDINRRGSVDGRLAYGKNGVLPFDAPEYMHGDTALGKQSVDHESVARIDDLLIAEIQDDKIFVNAGAAEDLLTKLRLVLQVKVHALFDIRQSENFFDRMISTVVDQRHHQLVIGNTELPKPPKPSTGIHQKVQERPAARLEDFITCELS